MTELKLNLNTGKVLDLAEFKGKPYIIRLFASWCEVCGEDAKELKELARRMGAPVIGIAIEDSVERINRLKKYELAYDYIAIDENNFVKNLLKNKSIPETIIIDADGKIILRHLGSL